MSSLPGGFRKGIRRSKRKMAPRGVSGKSYAIVKRLRQTRLSQGRWPIRPNAGPVPSEQFCQFVYTNISTVTTAGGIDGAVFCGNGLYDPEITFVGGQPYMFDQMMALYNNYYVYSSRFELDVCNNDAVPTHVALAPSMTSVEFDGADNVDDLRQQNGGKYAMLGPAAGAGCQKKLVAFCRSKDIFAYENTDDLKGNVSSNPTLKWYWHVALANDDAGNLAITYSWRITYWVKLFYRQTPSQS